MTTFTFDSKKLAQDKLEGDKIAAKLRDPSQSFRYQKIAIDDHFWFDIPEAKPVCYYRFGLSPEKLSLEFLITIETLRSGEAVYRVTAKRRVEYSHDPDFAYTVLDRSRTKAFSECFAKLKMHYCPEKSDEEMKQIGKSLFYRALSQALPGYPCPEDLVEFDIETFRTVKVSHWEKAKEQAKLDYLERLRKDVEEERKKIETSRMKILDVKEKIVDLKQSLLKSSE